jgi:hypothetical protein
MTVGYLTCAFIEFTGALGHIRQVITPLGYSA